MRSLLAILSKYVVRGRTDVSRAACFAGACIAFLCCDEKAVHAADLSGVLPTKTPPAAASAYYDWTGVYFGGHFGYAWGNSNWTTSAASGSLDLAQPIDSFNESGSFFAGIQTGYNHMLANRFVVGVEADASFPSFPNLAGISIGGISIVNSPTFGHESYSETVLSSGTLRGRIGYAPGQWLLYATGGFAWTYKQLTLTNLATGTADMPFLWRLGWAAGAGLEAPIAPHWTARLEYLFTDYGNSNVFLRTTDSRLLLIFLCKSCA